MEDWSGYLGADPAPVKGKKKDDKGGEHKNWLVRPVLGRLPGAGVLAIGAGVLTGIGFLIKRIVTGKFGFGR
jgi:hypothetical protein